MVCVLTASEGILEYLLKAQELQDRQIHCWMKSETTLVRSQGRIELHAVSSIDLNLVLVIFPHHTELDDALRDGGDLEGGAVFGVLLEQGRVLEGRGELCQPSVSDTSSRPVSERLHLCRLVRTPARMGDLTLLLCA